MSTPTTDLLERYLAALEIIAADDTDAPSGIVIRRRDIARTALSFCACGHRHASSTGGEDSGCQVCADGHDWHALTKPTP